MRAKRATHVTVVVTFIVCVVAVLGAIYFFLNDSTISAIEARSQVAGTFLTGVGIVAPAVGFLLVRYFAKASDVGTAGPALAIGKENGELGAGDPQAVTAFVRWIQAKPASERRVRVIHPLLDDHDFQLDRSSWKKLANATEQFETWATALLRGDVRFHHEPSVTDLAGALRTLWVQCGGAEGWDYEYWYAWPKGRTSAEVVFKVMEDSEPYRAVKPRFGVFGEKTPVPLNLVPSELVWERLVPSVIQQRSKSGSTAEAVPTSLDDWLVSDEAPR